ncbi:MAG TPA: hypothetical protein VND21_08545 [Planctomycetota bacterium]|nr:hypothetical protein [Planctomycetota bacterium]
MRVLGVLLGLLLSAGAVQALLGGRAPTRDEPADSRRPSRTPRTFTG